jgi:hypothetical protein
MDNITAQMIGCEFFDDDSAELAQIMIELQKRNVVYDSRNTPRVYQRSRNLQRDFLAAHQQIYADYFAEVPLYGPDIFERRYRMSRELFLTIANEMKEHDPRFQDRKDALGKPGLSNLQKCTAAMRMLERTRSNL